MNNYTEFAIKHDSVIKRVVTEEELDITDTVARAMSRNLIRITTRLLLVPDWGQVGIATATDNQFYLTLDLIKVPLLAEWKKTEDVLVPNFGARGARNKLPLLPMEWMPPLGMRLKMLIQGVDDLVNSREVVNKTWVFAMDTQGNTYRLPLPNLHADCALCSGQDTHVNQTIMGCLESVLGQFQKSQWNADLWDTVEQTQRMFRFKTKNEGFDQLPIDGDWTKLCKKVSVAVNKYLIQ